MPQVSLAQALKIKNRLTKEVRQLTELLNQWNSVIVGSERAIDVKASYQELKTKIESLARLKAAIQNANAPIQEKIFLLAELKGLAATLSRLNTASGPAPIGYSGEVTEYEAALSGAQVLEEQKRITKEMNRLQDEIDTYNALTQVEVETTE